MKNMFQDDICTSTKIPLIVKNRYILLITWSIVTHQHTIDTKECFLKAWTFMIHSGSGLLNICLISMFETSRKLWILSKKSVFFKKSIAHYVQILTIWIINYMPYVPIHVWPYLSVSKETPSLVIYFRICIWTVNSIVRNMREIQGFIHDKCSVAK